MLILIIILSSSIISMKSVKIADLFKRVHLLVNSSSAVHLVLYQHSGCQNFLLKSSSLYLLHFDISSCGYCCLVVVINILITPKLV